MNLEVEADRGQHCTVNSVFQVADLNRPLMSVSQVCDNGHKCVFEKDHALVIAPNGDVVCRFTRKSGLYVADMKLKAPSPFGRPGA